MVLGKYLDIMTVKTTNKVLQKYSQDGGVASAYKKSACNTAILRIFLEHLVSRLHRHYVEVFTKNHLLHPHETLLDHFKGRLKAPRTLCIARPASYAELLVDVWAPVFHVNRPRWARHGAGTTTDAQSVSDDLCQ